VAEWLYEDGIGEARAALVGDDGIILAARIEPAGRLRLGSVLDARVLEKTPQGARLALAGGGGEALLENGVPGLTQSLALRVTVVREAIPEAGRSKLARVIVSAEGAAPATGPALLERLQESGIQVRRCHAHEPDHFEAAGWSEVLDEAMTGEIAFGRGALRLSPTPAMTLFDVDGSAPLDALAVAAATAVARAIVRHDIGGSIGIDFPTLTGKDARQAVAAAVDASLPQPFERTALNGFGFMQIVRRRARASLPELLRADPVATAARAALRHIERTPPGGARIHRLPAAVRAFILARPDWMAELERRTGGSIVLEE